MACFLVPATEAIVTTIIAGGVKASEKRLAQNGEVSEGRLPFSKKLGWLNSMLWGGSALLAFEHRPFFSSPRKTREQVQGKCNKHKIICVYLIAFK